MANTYLPISISLKNRRCLVVGGGNVSIRKVDNLLDYEADITVIAPEPQDRIEYYAGKGLIKLEKRAYRSPEAADYGLVISASDDGTVNKSVYEDCQSTGVPVNVVDNPSMCDFIFPAVLKRDCLSLAVSTDGKAPFLSSHLRVVFENLFPETQWVKISKMAASFRKQVQKHWSNNVAKKAECYGEFLNADWKVVLKEKNNDEIEQLLQRMINEPSDPGSDSDDD